MLLSIDEIKTKNRVRRGDPRIEALMGSMAKFGLLNPIIVDSKNNLIAGYRRLEAARALGWKTICVSMVEGADRARALEIALEENAQRLELAPEDVSAAMARIERLRRPNVFARIALAIRDFFRRLFGRFF